MNANASTTTINQRIAYIQNRIIYFTQLAENANDHWREIWLQMAEGWRTQLEIVEGWQTFLESEASHEQH